MKTIMISGCRNRKHIHSHTDNLFSVLVKPLNRRSADKQSPHQCVLMRLINVTCLQLQPRLQQ